MIRAARARGLPVILGDRQQLPGGHHGEPWRQAGGRAGGPVGDPGPGGGAGHAGRGPGGAGWGAGRWPHGGTWLTSMVGTLGGPGGIQRCGPSSGTGAPRPHPEAHPPILLPLRDISGLHQMLLTKLVHYRPSSRPEAPPWPPGPGQGAAGNTWRSPIITWGQGGHGPGAGVAMGGAGRQRRAVARVARAMASLLSVSNDD